jgi:hypothetical protein
MPGAVSVLCNATSVTRFNQLLSLQLPHLLLIMSATSSTGNGAPTPDALRLSRLDRIIDAVGEHQLSIRHHVSTIWMLPQDRGIVS